MDTKIRGLVGVATPASGTTPILRAGRGGELMSSALMAPYYEQVKQGNVFGAYAIVTAPVIYTTAAATGGPLLWNGTTDKDCVLLGIGIGSSVVSTVAGTIGITGGSGQAVAPTATTVIDGRWNAKIGGAASAATPYRVGTPLVAGSFLMALREYHTGALTVDNGQNAWIPLDGQIIVPPSCWASVAASATLTTLVAQITLVWMEVPI